MHLVESSLPFRPPPGSRRWTLRLMRNLCMWACSSLYATTAAATRVHLEQQMVGNQRTRALNSQDAANLQHGISDDDEDDSQKEEMNAMVLIEARCAFPSPSWFDAVWLARCAFPSPPPICDVILTNRYNQTASAASLLSSS